VRGAFNHWERVKQQIVELSAKKLENDDVPGDWERTCALRCFLKARYSNGSLLRKQHPLK
jgi:hypothetical protein